jgi:hypothetical protein
MSVLLKNDTALIITNISRPELITIPLQPWLHRFDRGSASGCLGTQNGFENAPHSALVLLSPS